MSLQGLFKEYLKGIILLNEVTQKEQKAVSGVFCSC